MDFLIKFAWGETDTRKPSALLWTSSYNTADSLCHQLLSQHPLFYRNCKRPAGASEELEGRDQRSCNLLTWKHFPSALRLQNLICVEVLQELGMVEAQLPTELGVPLIVLTLEAAFLPLPQVGRTGSECGFASLGNLGISVL